MRYALCLLAFVVSAGPALAEVRSVRAIEPRPFGYFLGDVIERTVEIETAANDELIAASLPPTGASNYWLELRSAGVTTKNKGDGRVHTLKLSYQTFYAPIDPKKVVIPALEIAFRGPDGSSTAKIPPLTLLTSPLREIFPEKSGETSETFLRPDVRPEFRRTGALRTALLATGALCLVLLTLLARDRAWWPFHKRPVRPFTRAVRDVGRALAAGGSDAYRRGLVAMHRAFDGAAGHRVLAADLDGFFEGHPEHAATRDEVERFFAASRSVFFGDAPREGEVEMPPHALRELAAVLARQERAAR